MLWLALGVLLLAFVSLLVWLAADLLVLILAFGEDWVKGALCLLVPLYVVYYLVARLRHPRRRLLLAAYFGGLTGIALFGSLFAWVLPSAAEDLARFFL